MAIKTMYLRNTQTETGTGGTGQGSVWDLSETQGTSATLAADTNNSSTPVILMYWTVTVGTEVNSNSFPFSYQVTAIANTPAFYVAVARYNSSGTFVARSGNSTEQTAAGTYTGTLTLSTTWAAGDQLRLELWGYRFGGHSASTVTMGVNRTTSYVEYSAPAGTVQGTLPLTGDGTFTTGTPLVTAFGLAQPAGAGDLVADATVTAFGAAALDGAADFAATGEVHYHGAAALDGAGDLVANGLARAVGIAALAGDSDLVAAGETTAFGLVALTGDGALTAAGESKATGLAALTGTGNLVATGVTDASFQYARPDADVTVGGWITAPLWSKVNEGTENDSPYIESTDLTACELGLVDVDAPGDGTASVYVRAWKTLGGPADLRVLLMEGATQRASWLIDTLTESPVTYQLDLSPAEKAAVTDWTNVRLRLARE